jgi:hypothetical protein
VVAKSVVSGSADARGGRLSPTSQQRRQFDIDHLEAEREARTYAPTTGGASRTTLALGTNAVAALAVIVVA